MPLTWVVTRPVHQPQIPSSCPTLYDLTHHRHTHDNGVNEWLHISKTSRDGCAGTGFSTSYLDQEVAVSKPPEPCQGLCIKACPMCLLLLVTIYDAVLDNKYMAVGFQDLDSPDCFREPKFPQTNK